VVQLQSQRADVEKENARLQQELLVKDSLLSAAESRVQQPADTQQQPCLKQAKQLERQRAHKHSKQVAHQRLLRQQREAELCRVREEIEQEKASMLAAAEKELSAIKAHVKSQSRALRQKRRRAAAEQQPDDAERQTLQPQAPLLEPQTETQETVSCANSDHALAELPIVEGALEAQQHEDDTVSSVESAEIAESLCEEDLPEAKSQCRFDRDGDAVEEDWQVLSEGSDNDETAWDLIG